MQRTGGPGPSKVVKVPSGSLDKPPVIMLVSGMLLSSPLTSAETAGGFLSFPCGSEGEAQRPRPGGRFWALIQLSQFLTLPRPWTTLSAHQQGPSSTICPSEHNYSDCTGISFPNYV